MTFDPTGRWLAALDRSKGEVSVWDAHQGQLVHRVTAPVMIRPATEQVRVGEPDPSATVEVKVHPGGNRLAILAQGVIRLWDAAAGRELMITDRPGHLAPVTCVAQHPGAGLVASADKDAVILLWDRDQGHLRKMLFGHTAPISALAFQPDGRRLASAAEDGTVALWDPAGQRVWTYRDESPQSAFRGLAFHPSGTPLLVGRRDGQVLVLDPRSGPDPRPSGPGSPRCKRLHSHPTDGSWLPRVPEGGSASGRPIDSISYGTGNWTRRSTRSRSWATATRSWPGAGRST